MNTKHLKSKEYIVLHAHTLLTIFYIWRTENVMDIELLPVTKLLSSLRKFWIWAFEGSKSFRSWQDPASAYLEVTERFAIRRIWV